MSIHDQALEAVEKDLAEARARHAAARPYTQERRRLGLEVRYLERHRAKVIRAAREAEEERARGELQLARADARAAQTRAREIARYLPTGAQIRDAHRLRVTPSRNRNHARGARRRRLLALLRRTARAEELGASARQIEWARACLRIALEMKPGRVDMGAELVLPYLQCGVCGRVNCEHPLELAAQRPGGTPIRVAPAEVERPASAPANAPSLISFTPPPRAERRAETRPAFPWVAGPPKEK